ncbi:hypothetical protein [Streptomyces griseorubiginosus]|uniref:hypothetical protein n=1 Tax=Streptomyces griseorubiginosus TaxID=67304 RepID=UPI0034546D34
MTTATKTSNAVDKRSLLNSDQAAALLDWIRRRPRGGKRLHAFFATLYYCGPRPEEAVAMHVRDVHLPDVDAADQWCELMIHTATPEVGENGGILAGSVIRRAWRSARQAALAPHVFDSPTGKRVYDIRHTRLTKWLNDGIPPAQVAEWAGNSVPVLLATYARCVDGQLPDLKKRLEAAGTSPSRPTLVDLQPKNFDTYSTQPPAKTR